ncbi:hypothetical protein TNCV_345311 [Trichonephila clavipes]|nr:hypothetical protein TNCV_345311 [Trichonephila clavipes]
MIKTSKQESESDFEDENIINKHPGQKRKGFIESKTYIEDQHVEITVDGIVWEEIDENIPNQAGYQSIFLRMSAPTGYDK